MNTQSPIAHPSLRRLAWLLSPLMSIFAAALLVNFSVLTAAAQRGKAQTASPYFVGEVEYRVTASGTNESGIASFKAFSPTTIKVIYGQQGFRLIESGGTANNVVFNYAKREAYLLDDGAKTASKVFVQNLDDESAKEMAAILPYHYKTDMQPTGRTPSVGGQTCREYRVLKSAFIRDGAKATICVAEALKLKPSRYSFENETRRAVSPLPLSVPVPVGAILKAEVEEDGVVAVYEVVRITPGTPEAGLFAVPVGYKIKADK